MLVDELEIVDDSFELNDVKYGADGVLNIPLMDVYPNPENTFDVFLGADGFDYEEDNYSYQDGGFDVSGQDISGAVEGVGQIVQAFQKTGLKKTIKDTCGRKPVNKKKRESSGWNACEARVKAIALGEYTPPQQTVPPPPPPPPSRGMSMGTKVGIGLGIIALGVVGFIIYKRRQG